jgi:GNAT superfamily N-acetyltransferase
LPQADITIDHIRGILRKDPAWSIYALGDLDPRLFLHCDWRIHDGSLVLVVQAFTPPILFAIGDPEVCARLVPKEPHYTLQVRPDMALALSETYKFLPKPMVRMGLDPAKFTAAAGTAERLSPVHVAEIHELYRDGANRGESPDFFHEPMVAEGVFYGVREAGKLVAVAGTHLVSEKERVAAVGNVYTKLLSRGRGYARRTTSAVVAELLRRGIQDIALNVGAGNKPATHAYQSLGFHCACAYFEGYAVRI